MEPRVESTERVNNDLMKLNYRTGYDYNVGLGKKKYLFDSYQPQRTVYNNYGVLNGPTELE